MTDAGQAAEIIAELEMKKVEELKLRAQGLQQKLNALRMMEVKKEDWRQNLAAYAQEGCVVDGLQVLFTCPVFKDLPEAVTATMVPNVEVNDQKGWGYLKQLPLCRRASEKVDEVQGMDPQPVWRQEGECRPHPSPQWPDQPRHQF